VWPEIVDGLRALDPLGPDLYVNQVEARMPEAWADEVHRQFPKALVLLSPNLGQDIGGTLALLSHVDFSQYDLVCKLHTKKSDWLPGRAGLA
jgi:lipopolysaccharide biosynthesis protein